MKTALTLRLLAGARRHDQRLRRAYHDKIDVSAYGFDVSRMLFGLGLVAGHADRLGYGDSLRSRFAGTLTASDSFLIQTVLIVSKHAPEPRTVRPCPG